MATRKSFKRPITKTSNPQPQNKRSKDWIIWAAWADRITFEDIKRETGKSEGEVIKIMRSALKSSSFKLWRRRVHTKSIKNLKKFKENRLQIRDKSYKKTLENDS